MLDEVFGERLLISETADKRELNSNLRAVRANAGVQTRREIESLLETLRP